VGELPVKVSVKRKVPTRVIITGVNIPFFDLVMLTSKILGVATLFAVAIIITTLRINSKLEEMELERLISTIPEATKILDRAIEKQDIELERLLKQIDALKNPSN